jgi:hypothetical protein
MVQNNILKLLALLTLSEGIPFYSLDRLRYHQRILEEYKELSRNILIEPAIRELGYHLDLIITDGQLICFYLGKINETLITAEGNSFYMTYSKAKGMLGAPYPISLQPNPITPYTRGELSWIDSRIPVDLRRTNPILSGLDQSVLKQIRTDGEINYISLSSNKSREVH